MSARSDREFRALEVCEMMAEPHTLQLAIKYACRLKYMQLAERISEVVQRKSAEQEEEEQEEIQTSQRLRKFFFKDYDEQSKEFLELEPSTIIR